MNDRHEGPHVTYLPVVSPNGPATEMIGLVKGYTVRPDGCELRYLVATETPTGRAH